MDKGRCDICHFLIFPDDKIIEDGDVIVHSLCVKHVTVRECYACGKIVQVARSGTPVWWNWYDNGDDTGLCGGCFYHLIGKHDKVYMEKQIQATRVAEWKRNTKLMPLVDSVFGTTCWKCGRSGDLVLYRKRELPPKKFNNMAQKMVYTIQNQDEYVRGCRNHKPWKHSTQRRHPKPKSDTTRPLCYSCDKPTIAGRTYTNHPTPYMLCSICWQHLIYISKCEQTGKFTSAYWTKRLT